jgi:hypothetical protein
MEVDHRGPGCNGLDIDNTETKECDKEMKDETEHKVNWTPVLVVAGIGVTALIIGKLFFAESEADREQARLILEDWQLEFYELKNYTETIYAGGRTPTEQEIAIMSSMLDQMKIKEETIQQLSRSVFGELQDVIEAAARNWWLMPVVIITPIAGYMTYKLVKGWFNNRRPPPNFPCPKCDGVFSTEGALKHHIQTDHQPDITNAFAAQQNFAQTSTWVQNAVAVESYYAKTYTNWGNWSLPTLRNLNWALTSAWVYGIGAAAEIALLRTALMLLLI